MQTNNINGSGIVKSPFLDNLKKVRNSVETELRKVFTLPDNESPSIAKKTEGIQGNVQSLDGVLSTEEKKLFESLFPVTKATVNTGRTFKSYAVQQKHSIQTQISSTRIVGGNLDIKG